MSITKRLKRIFEPVAIVCIIAGIVGLIQPIHLNIFRLGFNVLWVGLVLYMIFSHFK